jgi:eukaryotic-like serine/threonine-protein kinase
MAYVNLSRFTSPDPETSRAMIRAGIIVVLFMGISAAVAFFVALHGADQTMVPDLRGRELTNALLEMQDKELYPKIQLRYSDRADDRGKILDQKPGPGAIVKAGKRITLVVSRGMVIDKIENFVGQDLNEVKLHLQSKFTSTAVPLITIQEPPQYIFDPKPAGTVLQQKPVPDTPVSGPVSMVFVVSKGPEKAKLAVPNLIGVSFDRALRILGDAKIEFTLTSRAPERQEAPLTVVSESPAAGTSIPASAKLNLVLTNTGGKSDSGKVFGLLSQALPEYPYAIKISVVAILPSGEKNELFSGVTSGGDFSVPYYLPADSQVVLSILGQEKYRLEVGSE